MYQHEGSHISPGVTYHRGTLHRYPRWYADSPCAKNLTQILKLIALNWSIGSILHCQRQAKVACVRTTGVVVTETVRVSTRPYSHKIEISLRIILCLSWPTSLLDIVTRGSDKYRDWLCQTSLHMTPFVLIGGRRFYGKSLHTTIVTILTSLMQLNHYSGW